MFTGFTHSSYTFAHESQVTKSYPDMSSFPPGALIRFLQKGMQFTELEANLKEVQMDMVTATQAHLAAQQHHVQRLTSISSVHHLLCCRTALQLKRTTSLLLLLMQYSMTPKTCERLYRVSEQIRMKSLMTKKTGVSLLKGEHYTCSRSHGLR